MSWFVVVLLLLMSVVISYIVCVKTQKMADLERVAQKKIAVAPQGKIVEISLFLLIVQPKL